MSLRTLFSLTTIPFLAVAAFGASGVSVTEKPDRVTIEINGKLFTELRFAGAPHV